MPNSSPFLNTQLSLVLRRPICVCDYFMSLESDRFLVKSKSKLKFSICYGGFSTTPSSVFPIFLLLYEHMKPRSMLVKYPRMISYNSSLCHVPDTKGNLSNLSALIIKLKAIMPFSKFLCQKPGLVDDLLAKKESSQRTTMFCLGRSLLALFQHLVNSWYTYHCILFKGSCYWNNYIVSFW